ncbi:MULTISPECIES: winged helix-turn-helix domain-containing protein [Thermomonosporaceae]|uniref:winged helix-turn-helix domain-containing protein n=1 Tax=Thermomonosporaceae TaxID=2012 RepID=UPI00255A8C6D|nr:MULTISPECIES: crosslink repair DNA glycosylase YcaQ family protein [Thermomonosporaceae]MDL4776008.1 crosslink repair DNA glycosylase YcaQ family protein [Actinomadura xylanilytica]
MIEAELSADEVRRLQLRAQGLLGARGAGGVTGLLRRLGAVQLDTISVLARSHELVPYARLGAVGRDAVEAAYWGSGAFEYWAHAASVLPMDEWPLFAFRRRAFRRRGWRWHKVPEGVCQEILARLRADGPLTTKELGGAKASADWWDWSDHKIGIEWLLDVGEVVCARRVGWRRVYDLAERAVPAPLLDQEPDDEACLEALVARAGRALGVATRADLADYYRVKAEQVDAVIGATGLVPVRVEGWRHAAWADPAALAEPARGRHVTTLLSPFDSLVWDRARTSRVFGFDHRLEAYVPKAKRVHGYFAMPLLSGGRLLGRVDPAREGTTLVARQVSFEPSATRTRARTEASAAALGAALWRAAGWVGCDDVRVERLDPGLDGAQVAAVVRAAG